MMKHDNIKESIKSENRYTQIYLFQNKTKLSTKSMSDIFINSHNWNLQYKKCVKTSFWNRRIRK